MVIQLLKATSFMWIAGQGVAIMTDPLAVICLIMGIVLAQTSPQVDIVKQRGTSELESVSLLNVTTCPTGCICLELTVRCMLVGIKEPPSIPTHAQVVDLRFNRIKRIPQGAFKDLVQLDTLLLNNNHIHKLRKGAFDGLENLKYLYLYKNKITYIDEKVFQNLPKLEHLYLHYNYVKHLEPNQFFGLGLLQRLFLHSNKLHHLPSNIFQGLDSLKRLRVDNNPISCDCEISWLSAYIRSNAHLQVTANCRDPRSDIATINLEKLDPTDFACGEPIFLEEPTDSDVTPGGTIRFRCRASGSPSPEIVWKKDGVLLDPATDSRVRLLGRGVSLVIVAARPADVGLYECVAKSEQGEITSRSARVRYYQQRAKPSITHRPVYTEVTKGGEIRLSCAAEGFPRPTFEWYKDGGRLSNAHDRFKILDDGTLYITNAQLDDAAHYRCSATNYLGLASSSARVKVNLALPESIPRITSKPRDATVQETTIVEFTCIAEGHPYPDFSWWKNKRLVNNDGRISVSNGGQHLRIQDLRTYDQGEYVCRVENRLGKVEASADLVVQVIPTPIAIVHQPHDMSAPPGATVQLPCKAEGSPEPKITWVKDGRSMINDKRHRLSPDGSLIVYNVTEEDVGMYECVAENERERRTARAYFSIRDIPYEVGQPGRGDDFVLLALDEASKTIRNAINNTVTRLFSRGSAPAATPGDLLKVFRYPPESERAVAQAAEIYERTLELVAKKIHEERTDYSQDNLATFKYEDLISPANLEVIANMSGCEAHRASRQTNCTDMCFHAKYRSIDGTCNNFNDPMQGASLTSFRRILPAQYENGFSTPIGWNRGRLYNGFPKPSARLISSELITTSKITEDSILSHMVMQWGQFLDHDIDHSMEAISRETFENGITCGAICENSPPCFPIEVPDGDLRITPDSCMEFTRSSAACGSGSTSVFFDKIQPREQLNQLTSFIDASQVYGSQADLSTSLRNLTNDNGRLREGPQLGYAKPLLPFNLGFPIDCRRDPTESNIGCFLAGDVRANEHVALLSMHTLWFREHNRLVTELRELNPHWTGENLYHEARKIVGAQMQHITYAHWLPLIIGSEGMEMIGKYNGYNPQTDASISNVFAASAFRFGHTLVNPVLKRLGPDFETIAEGNLPLGKAFFSPWRLVQEGGVDPILRGLFASSAKRNMPNEVMNSELTEKLFEVAHAVALDLGALNIQRGRDHGLPSYAEWREHCGFGPIKSFDDLAEYIKDSGVRRKLERIYGHPGNIDVWVGGLLEDSVEDGRVGPLVRCILVEQFKRLREGDRFWYENPSTFSPEQLTQIRQVTLGRVVCDNGDDIAKVTPNVFLKPKEKADIIPCSEVPKMSLNVWFECEATREDLLSTQQDRRFRRHLDYSVANGTSHDSNEDVMEIRIEGLEEELRLTRRKLSKIRREFKLFKKALRDGNGDNAVCLDHDGNIRADQESWMHSPCVQCLCDGFQVKCLQIQDCQK
ncbi:peroxidasin-like isoform X1 [Tigriopus californicus]|uniref:peroxidasin-like isoform X1 n=1 Tax=Tigriopus californicus TaxID=6832 RepID=UPI0027DA015B|nr:peroxidasin-like isoform X1 [Tigriopus californicus]